MGLFKKIIIINNKYSIRTEWSSTSSAESDSDLEQNYKGPKQERKNLHITNIFSLYIEREGEEGNNINLKI